MSVMITILKKFKRLLNKKQKSRVAILFFITLIGTLLEILGVTLMIPMVSAIMSPNIIETNKGVKWVCELLDLHSHRTFVIVCIAALILVFIFKDVFLILQYYAQTRFVCNNRFSTQKRMMHAFMQRPYEYYINSSFAEVSRVINSDVNQVYTLLTTLLFMASELVVSFGLIVTIFVIDPMMTIFVAVMMGVIILIITLVVKPKLKKQGVLFQKGLYLSGKFLTQSIYGMKEIKVSDTGDFFEKQYEYAGNILVKSEKAKTIMGHVPRLLIEMVSVCSMLALIAIEIFFGREIETLVPTLGAFGMAAVKLMPSANRIVSAYNEIAYNQPALDSLLQYMDEFERIEEENAKLTADSSLDVDLKLDDKIELKNITYRYPNSDVNVLENASMEIPIGKSVGIVGASGAGKTTAVDIMLGLLKPQSGEVLVDGVNIMNNYKEWLSHIGYIPQMIYMIDEPIRENVAFGCAKEKIDDEKVWSALRDACLEDFVKEYPNGLDATIGERGIRMSGGQRQRLGIARALYNNPDLLLFDEATSALDNETEAAIMESINSLHGKKTMVIIAHRLQTIEGCDIVYRVKNGKIIRER